MLRTMSGKKKRGQGGGFVGQNKCITCDRRLRVITEYLVIGITRDSQQAGNKTSRQTMVLLKTGTRIGEDRRS